MGMTRSKLAHARRGALVLGAGVVVAGSLVLVGCAGPVERRMPTEPEPTLETGSWGGVMLPPTTQLALAGHDPRTDPEYARSDRRLNPKPDTVIAATSQWPQPERDSLWYTRRVYFDPRAEVYTVFDKDSRYRGYSGYGYGREGYGWSWGSGGR